ncbi:MAG: hypothetical protein WD768_07285 [Phycisphaeraceae bacterium]
MIVPGQLGFGHDGHVFVSNEHTAIKVHERATTYRNELAVYQRLRERGVDRVADHHVPKLIDWDDTRLIIEMSIVPRPFVLDFASAMLDHAPRFPQHVIDERTEHWLELFGENWEQVPLIVLELELRAGVYLLDPHPGNIAFEDD